MDAEGPRVAAVSTHRTVCLGIIHAAHLPERRASMARLRAALFPLPPWVTHYREHNERESSRQWASRSWNWALQTWCDFSVSLNDDVIPCPQFWGAMGAMLRVLPDGVVLGLGTVDPRQEEAAREGKRWLTFDYVSTVGWGVGLHMGQVRLLVEKEGLLLPDHRSPHSHDECMPDCNLWHEDSWANETLTKAGHIAWHPIPSILTHDLSLPSTYANDHHKTRAPRVTWENVLTFPEFWRPHAS